MKPSQIALIALLCLPLILQLNKAFASEASPLQTKSIYLSESRWKNQEASPLKLSELRGTPVVVSFLFTSCKASCPLILNDLKTIEKGVPEANRSKIRFAIFSFDSENDTPAKLKSFAELHQLNLKTWSLYQGNPSSVRELTSLLGIRYKKVDSAVYDHSNIISILDPEGVIYYQQMGIRKNVDETIKALNTLIKN